MKKRTEGKIKNCMGLKELYKFYKASNEGAVNYKTFTTVIKECNKALVDVIIEDSEKVQLPYRLGALHVAKFERQWSDDKRYWALDFKKTKEHGFAIYHEQENLYKWRWEKNYAIVKNKFKFKFHACRYAKRRVAQALLNKKDYYTV